MDSQRGAKFKTMVERCRLAAKAVGARQVEIIGELGFKPVTVILLLLLVQLSAFAASYYVTQSGAGSQNGLSLSNAWSAAAFNSSGAPTGGDTVFFSGSFVSTISPRTSGTGDGASRLTLNFTAATLNNANPRISILGRSFLNLMGGVFGSDNGTTQYLVDYGAMQSHDITISGWTHTGTLTSTCHFINSFFCYNAVYSNNSMESVEGFAIGDSTLNHDILISGNYCRTSLNVVDQTDVIFFGDAYNLTIEKNKLINRTVSAASVRHNDIIQCYEKGGSNAGNPTNWIVRYNWLEMAALSGSGDNSFMMMENMDGSPAIKIYGNVFIGTGLVGNNGICFDSNASTAKVYFYNNTVIRHGTPDNTVRFLSPGVLYARNNLGMADPGTSGTFAQWTFTAGSTWNYNFFYQCPLVDSSEAGPNGSISTNPLFTNYLGNDFSLQATSRLKGAGDSSIGSEFNQGLVQGATWPNPTLVARSSWDIGAYQSGLTPPQPQNLRVVPSREQNCRWRQITFL